MNVGLANWWPADERFGAGEVEAARPSIDVFNLESGGHRSPVVDYVLTVAVSLTLNDHQVAVPVDDSMMKRIAQLSGGQTYSASNIDELNRSYAAVQQQAGYQTVQGPASVRWLRLAVIIATIATIAALVIHRRLPV